MKSIYKMSVFKKCLLLTFTLIFFSVTFLFVNSFVAHADASTLAMDGASVKFVDMNEEGVSASIRFSASIDKDEYDELLAEYPQMKVYMRIGAKETLAAYKLSDINSDTACSKIINLDVSSAKTAGKKDSNDVYYFRAYATNIKKAHLDKELLCMCYIDDGNGVVLAETASITRSITYVSKAALDDISDSSEGLYTNAINASVDNAYRAEEVVYGYNGKYSRYTADQRVKLWTGVADEQFDFYGYTSPTDGSYLVDGTEYGSGENYQTVERYAEYLDSGNNIVLLGRPVYNGKNYQAWEQSATKVAVDRAVAGGVDRVIIYDNRLVELSKTEGGLIGNRYADTAALDTYVASCLADYRYYKGIYGVMLYDEPTYARIQAYAETYASIKRVAPEMFVQTNLLGYTMSDDANILPTKAEAVAAGYTLTDSGETLTDYDKRYELYISTFATVSGADYLQFDMYPMAASNIWGWYIRGLTVAANYCKIKGIDMNVVTQTMKMAVDGNDTRSIDEVHARWLNNMIIGFGAKSVSYFTYQAKEDNSTEENGQYFYSNESFLNRDGKRTQLWYDMQKIMQEEQGLAPYILGFDYENYKIYSGTKTSGYSNGYVTDATFANTTPLSEMSATVDKDYLLVTELKNSDNVYMYMLQNITDPTVSVRQAITATFVSGYTHVLVFYKGAYSVYELNGSRQFKVWLSSGDAVYVVPFTSDIPAVSGPQARSGYNKEIKVGSTVNFHDYFVYYTNNCTVSYKKVGEANFTKICDRLQTWTPSSTGVYTLRYYVESGAAAGVHAGNLDIVVRVVAPDITYNNVSISDSIVKEYNKGSTLSFATFLDYVNVSSYSYSYTKRIASVSHNGVVTEFSSETAYTFSDIGEYVLTYEIVPEYGNAYQGYITIDVKDIQSGASDWISSNGIVYSGAYEIAADLSVILKPGFYQGVTYKNAKSSYIAYNGSYGTGSYVVFDFTGNNLPQLSFFNKTVTSSLFDGEEGIYISNGSTDNYGGNASQAMAGRFTVYGPYKIKEYLAYNDYDLVKGGVLYSRKFFPWTGTRTPDAISKLALEDGVSYRYIVGFQDGEAGDGSTVKLQVLLINCDTGETVYTFDRELNPAEATTTCDAFPEDYFTGSIVAYGSFGRTLVLDKIYPVYTGISDISELSNISSFKTTAPDKAVKGRTLSVSDFCDTSVNYTFYYKDASGNKTTVSDSTFSLAAAGEYILYYANNDKNENFGSMTITVYDNPWYEVRHQLERIDGTFYYDEDLTDILTGASGSTTAAAARTINGYTARAFTQTTVADDCSTIVNIYYDRDEFVESFEAFEFTGGNTREGSYNIIPNANGNSDNTYDYYVYAVNGSAAALSYSQFLTSSDSYSGYKSLEFKNYNTVTSMWVYVRLNDTIQQAVANGASITFRYKVEANDNSCAKYLALEINDVVHNLEIARSGQGEWQEVTLTSLNSGRIKFYVPDDAATGNIAGGAQSSSRYGWNLFIDDIQTSTTYTVKKYLEQSGGSYELYSSEVFGGTAGTTTSVVADNISGFIAQSVEQAVITAGHGTVVNVYYDIDRSIESFENMTSIDSSKYYLTSPVAADAVQLSNLSNVSGSHSVVYYLDADTTRSEMYANIVLNDTMKEKLEEGNFLSFAWLSSGLASSQYTIYSVYTGAAGGTCTQTVVSGIDWSYWNVAKATAIARSGNATFNTFTITDATVLAEIADTGILQIKITADNWKYKLHTTLWVDDIKIIDGVDYTVVTRLLSNDGETYNEYSRQTLKAVKGGSTNAVAADIEGFVAPVSIEQLSVADDGSTIIYLDYTRNDLIENFTAETSVNNGIIASTTNITSSAIVNDTNNSGGKALRFESNGNDSVAISIAFTEAMKDKLAAGTGILTFRYRMEKVSGVFSGQTVSINGATWDKLDETAGTTAENATSFTCWTANSDQGKYWYKATITSDYDDFTDKDNLTITFTKASGTAGAFYFYIDDIKVEDAASYTVEHYFDDGTGNYVLDTSKTQTIFGMVGKYTNAVAYSIPDYSVRGNVVQSVITADNATVIKIYYDYNRLNLDFTEYTAGDNNLDIVKSTAHITGYEIVNDTSNSGGSALRFTTDGSDSGINIQIALTDAQKNAIADGGVLSFRFRACHLTAKVWDRWSININGNSNKWYMYYDDGSQVGSGYRTNGIAVYQANDTTWLKAELDMAYASITDTLNITLAFSSNGNGKANEGFYFYIDDINVVESATRSFGGYAVGDNNLKIVTDTANIKSYEIVNDASNSGGKALRFTTNGSDSGINIQIALTDAQKNAIADGGVLSFRYRAIHTTANSWDRWTINVNGNTNKWYLDGGTAYRTAGIAVHQYNNTDWHKVELDMAYTTITDTLNITLDFGVTGLSSTFVNNPFYFFIDDIVVVPAS